MADVVDVRQVFSGRRTDVFRFQATIDTANEAAVQKIDISAFVNSIGQIATYTTIDRIEFAVNNFDWVQLLWDHTADDEIATLSGQGIMDFTPFGGLVDPRTAGGTGDILLTTAGTPADGCAYDITIYLRFKA